jgi:hypothetical protein
MVLTGGRLVDDSSQAPRRRSSPAAGEDLALVSTRRADPTSCMTLTRLSRPAGQILIGNVASAAVATMRNIIATAIRIHWVRELPNRVEAAAKNSTNAKSTVRME